MRIVGGTHRSRKLNTLDGNATRPTQDKIKEAMFSAMGPLDPEGVVLDLFAGSGNVGLEAISRGSKQVYLSDSSRDAIRIINSNVKLLKEEKRCIVMHKDYQTMLDTVAQLQFDFIFIDPPYANKIIEECLLYIEKHNMLADWGTIIVETSKNDIFLDSYLSLHKWKERTYGITRLTYFKKESK